MSDGYMMSGTKVVCIDSNEFSCRSFIAKGKLYTVKEHVPSERKIRFVEIIGWYDDWLVVPASDPVDPVAHPNHYAARDGSGVECIDAIRAMLGPDGFQAYCLGCAMKYQWRAGRKTPDAATDLAKAKQYLDFAAPKERGNPPTSPE